MKKNNILKLVCSTLACFAVVSVGNYYYDTQAVNNLSNNLYDNVIEEEPIIYTEVSSYETKYNFSDNEILAEHSDLIVIGKVTNLSASTNYNPTTKKYGKTRTPGNLEIIEIVKNDKNVNVDEIEFLDWGGTISYSEYEKSLLPAQKAKRDYLMAQNGVSKTRGNVYVRQTTKNQLEIEEGKTYVMYLKYDSDFDKYMVISQPHGVKEYNTNTGKVLNHVKNSVETVEELM